MEDLFGTIYEFLATEEKYQLIITFPQLKFLKQYTFDNNVIDLLIKKNDKVIIKKIICNGLKIESSHAIIYWAIERDYLSIIKILKGDVIKLSKKFLLQCKAVEYNSINVFNYLNQQLKPSQSQKNHILTWAASHGRLNMMLPLELSKNIDNPIICAAENGHLDIIKHFVKQCDTNSFYYKCAISNAKNAKIAKYLKSLRK